MKKIKIKRKVEKGITLIALVITIIVLLILAGVSIAMLTGENGILNQAQRAKTETENAVKQEEEDLAKLEAIINGQEVPIIQVDDENPGQLEQENDTTFVINSIEDLVFFSYDVTNGNKYENQTVKLGTNLDFNSDKSYVNPNRTDFEQYGYSGPLKQALTSGTGFSPIGELTTSTSQNLFYGMFDGDNKAICSLYINLDSDEQVLAGLFSVNYGEIINLGLVNANITVEGLQGTQGGLTSVGGLVGISYNNIYNSYVTGSINVTGDSWMNVGGICGVIRNGDIIESYNLATIECKNIAEKRGDNDIACGGITGGEQENNNARIERCFNRGDINADCGNVQAFVGGILGTTNQADNFSLKNCYNNAKIQGSTSTTQSNCVGGIAGYLNSTNVSNCYNVGVVEATKNGNTTTGDRFGVGGIIAIQGTNTEISNVFNKGTVISKNYYEDFRVGGIVGNIRDDATNSINNAYNTGSIDANGLNSSQVGSIAGSNLVTFSNCFYLKGTYDIGVAGSETAVGVTEWDSLDKFPSVLEVVNGDGAFKEDTNNINNGYPILNWQ